MQKLEDSQCLGGKRTGCFLVPDEYQAPEQGVRLEVLALSAHFTGVPR